MGWYLGALTCYAIGYFAYAGLAHLGFPPALAGGVGIAVGAGPIVFVIVRRVRRHLNQRREVLPVATPVAAPRIVPAPTPPANVPLSLVPCRRCGAAMEFVERAADIERVRCRYCALVDDVPLEAAHRLGFLRTRVAELRSARQALPGIDRRMAATLENGTWLRGTLLAALGPLSLITIFLVIPGIVYGGRHGAFYGLTLLLQLGGIVLGMALVYRALGRRYYRVIRPRILARPPERPGAPARCRVCGGPIEVRGFAFVDCAFCGSPNLVTTELVQHCDRYLAAEVDDYMRRARAAEAELDRHQVLVGRGILAGNLLGSIAGSTIGTLILYLLLLR